MALGREPREAEGLGAAPLWDTEAQAVPGAGGRGTLVFSLRPGTRSTPQGQSSAVTEKATASGGSSRHRQGGRLGGWGPGHGHTAHGAHWPP